MGGGVGSVNVVKPQPRTRSLDLDSCSTHTSPLSLEKNSHDALSSHSDLFMSCVSSGDLDSTRSLECRLEDEEEIDVSLESVGIYFNTSQESAEKVSFVGETVCENGTLSKTKELIKQINECTVQETTQGSQEPTDLQHQGVLPEQSEPGSTHSVAENGMVPNADAGEEDNTLRAVDEPAGSSASAAIVSHAEDTDTGINLAMSSEASSQLEQQDKRKSEAK